MNNHRFTDEGTIPLIQEDEDYDVYGTPNTSRVERHHSQSNQLPQK